MDAGSRRTLRGHEHERTMGEPGPRRIITVDPPEPATAPEPAEAPAPPPQPEREPEKVPA